MALTTFLHLIAMASSLTMDVYLSTENVVVVDSVAQTLLQIAGMN